MIRQWSAVQTRSCRTWSWSCVAFWFAERWIEKQKYALKISTEKPLWKKKQNSDLPLKLGHDSTADTHTYANTHVQACLFTNTHARVRPQGDARGPSRGGIFWMRISLEVNDRLCSTLKVQWGTFTNSTLTNPHSGILDKCEECRTFLLLCQYLNSENIPKDKKIL